MSKKIKFSRSFLFLVTVLLVLVSVVGGGYFGYNEYIRQENKIFLQQLQLRLDAKSESLKKISSAEQMVVVHRYVNQIRKVYEYGLDGHVSVHDAIFQRDKEKACLYRAYKGSRGIEVSRGITASIDADERVVSALSEFENLSGNKYVPKCN